MCGIAGLYNSSLDNKMLEEISSTMISQLSHRGPDGNSFKIIEQKNSNRTLLVHTRLSIIDLSEAAVQPMTDNKGRVWITFNGEIYNHLELRKELESLGASFNSNSDTEVIIEAYKAWGLKCFDKFIGMWALGLWDSEIDSLILSRDRLGIKPLYYSHSDKGLVFGSEPKIMTKFKKGPCRLNPRAISDYFGYRYVLDGKSFFSDIESLEAGTHLVFSKGKANKIKYWELPIEREKDKFNEEKLKEDLMDLLKSSVKYRMISDVPFGAFLSGGLDSSILVSIMNRLQEDPIRTYTIGFAEEGFNEFSYAQEVSDYLNTNHTQTIMDPDSYLEAMLEMIKIKDAPLAVPNEIALHKMSKILKKDISVVLSGEGADELFGGYGRIFRSAYDYERVTSQQPINTILKQSLLEKYKNLDFKNDLDHFLSEYSYIGEEEKLDLFKDDFLKVIGSDLSNRKFFVKLWNPLEGIELTEKIMWIFQKVHLEGLLGRLDSATMSASVEGRVPFVDHRLIEFINKVPTDLKMKWKGQKEKMEAEFVNSNLISENLDITKYILREAYKNSLPKSISDRKKVGFPVPLQNWLSGPLKKYAENRLLGKNSRTESIFNRIEVKQALKQADRGPSSGLKVWMMLNIEEWMRIYDIQS